MARDYWRPMTNTILKILDLEIHLSAAIVLSTLITGDVASAKPEKITSLLGYIIPYETLSLSSYGMPDRVYSVVLRLLLQENVPKSNIIMRI